MLLWKDTNPQKASKGGTLMEKRFDITPVILSFAHAISADEITILRRKNPEKTLLAQLEDKINEEIKKQGILP